MGAFECSSCLFDKKCGKGAECKMVGCSFCTGICHNSKPNSQNRNSVIEYGTQKMAYKIPYIEMTQELIKRFKESTIGTSDVIQFFKDVSERCKKDIKQCKDRTELKEFDNLALKKHTQLSDLSHTKTDMEILKDARDFLNLILTLPEDINISIDRTSSILDGVPGIYKHFINVHHVCIM